MDFNQRLLNNQYRLSEIEKEIAEYIQNNKEEVAQARIVSMATGLYVAPNTITRFCHKLGYDGFSELKISLKLELQRTIENEFEAILIENFNLMDPQREKEVIRLFQKYPKVNFFALEQAVVIAKACTEHFYTLTDKFRLYQYENELVRQIERDTKSIFFFISLSGESSTILKLAHQAKLQGHKVISLTNLTENNLSKISDIALYCYTTQKKYGSYDVTDKTPLMLIMQSLYRRYLEMQDNTTENEA